MKILTQTPLLPYPMQEESFYALANAEVEISKRPLSLPYDATETNVPKLKAFLLKNFPQYLVSRRLLEQCHV